jgi:pimeloyl-ACP methyl ester carboxylesterase
MATARVNGVELYYEATGRGDCLVLTHGSWTDGNGWDRVVAGLAERYRVVVWDRRGHSRSQAGDGPGSRGEDAADLAGLIEHVSGEPVHAVGNSYGAIVTLTLLTARPDLVATATVHEPPLWGLLEGTRQQALVDALSTADAELAVVRDLIISGHHHDAAEHFVEHVALGPGTWNQLPEPFRAVFEANTHTYLDEMADPTALSVDMAALATTTVPLLLTHGTESPALFPAVVAELVKMLPAAQVGIFEGAGHIPHATHPQEWIARLTAFHEQLPRSPRAQACIEPARIACLRRQPLPGNPPAPSYPQGTTRNTG